MYFDARSAKGLTTGQHLVVQGCPGLRLEVGATTKTWTYRYRSPVDGKLKQVKLGSWPAMPPAAAVAAWQDLREKREQGYDVVEDTRRQRAEVAMPKEDANFTIGQVIEHYAEFYLVKNREPRGAKVIAQRLRNAAGHKHATVLCSEVTRLFAFNFIRALDDRPVLARSVKTELAAAWRFAIESGVIPENTPNWWAEKSSLKLRSKGALRDGVRKGTVKRVLSEQEIASLLGEDLALFSQQVQDFLQLQLWTCTRGGEICQMRRNQVRLEKDVLWWTIPKEVMKIRHVDAAFDLRVPLLGRAREIVERLMQSPGDFLFPSVSRRGVVRGQTQAYMQSKVHYMQPYSKTKPEHTRRRLKVTHWSPHDLRRTGRTVLSQLGCPHEIAEAILGHVLPGVAGVYNLYRFDAERKVWLGRWDAWLKGVTDQALMDAQSAA